ncbi:TPA: hypothetical protein ACH3X3_003562 [Trebouxia sp. C0006]
MASRPQVRAGTQEASQAASAYHRASEEPEALNLTRQTVLLPLNLQWRLSRLVQNADLEEGAVIPSTAAAQEATTDLLQPNCRMQNSSQGCS